MHSLIRPNVWVVLRLPNDSLKPTQIAPNTAISLGKYGSFPANLLLGRPYNLTFELRHTKEGTAELRIVPASEIHAEAITDENSSANPSTDDQIIIGGNGVEFKLVGEDGEVIMRSNREIIDDSARQTLTMEEIEELKKNGTDAGKDLIAKLMLSHTALDQKTAFSLAKYKLLKEKKYLRQFKVLPLDVAMLTTWLIEDKDANRILEMREELLALVGCWGNVHFTGDTELTENLHATGAGRWLVVDEVGGLLVASMAERMGFLHLPEDEDEDSAYFEPTDGPSDPLPNGHLNSPSIYRASEVDSSFATSNTITLIHTNAQPNLSLLKYFSYFADTPQPNHPLTRHLKTLSWLQLLHPQEDTTYSTPPSSVAPAELAAMKSGKRGNYYRKHRRYQRTRIIVDETRAGSFDGLVCASAMDPIGILKACVPLLRGGAPVVIYSPTVEPLVHLADSYSTSRRTAFITSPPEDGDLTNWAGNDDFPLNPTLLLGVSVQTSKVRQWQVLPGRTHPLMTGKGGAEGYIFTGIRVLPAEGKIEARGKFKRKRIGLDQENGGSTGAMGTPENDSIGPAEISMEVQ